MVAQILLCIFIGVTSLQFSRPPVTFFTHFLTEFVTPEVVIFLTIMIFFLKIQRPTYLCPLISNSCRIVCIFWLSSLLRSEEVDYELCEKVD